MGSERHHSSQTESAPREGFSDLSSIDLTSSFSFSHLFLLPSLILSSLIFSLPPFLPPFSLPLFLPSSSLASSLPSFSLLFSFLSSFLSPSLSSFLPSYLYILDTYDFKFWLFIAYPPFLFSFPLVFSLFRSSLSSASLASTLALQIAREASVVEMVGRKGEERAKHD